MPAALRWIVVFAASWMVFVGVGCRDEVAESIARGDAFLAAGDLESADAAYSMAIEASPDDPKARFGRAAARLKLNHSNDALQDLSRVVETAPDAEAYYRRGALRLDLLDFEGAAQDLTEALKRQPNHVEALSQRAETRFETLDYEEALLDWEEADRLSPGTPPPLLRAKLLIALARLKEAQEVCTAVAAAKGGDEGYALWLRAAARERDGDTAGAEQDRAAAILLDSSLDYENSGLGNLAPQLRSQNLRDGNFIQID